VGSVDDQGFIDFYEATFQPVYGAARAFCGDADLAFEATQEAFARAYARWSRVHASEYPQAWVTKTAFNFTRRVARKRRDVLLPERLTPPLSGVRVDVVAALRRLPDRQRQAVVLHYMADCPVVAVAEVMGISEGAVKSHLFKARAALREELEVGHA